jgi:cytosine/adenosine deaminase-related metal-dependent hydrolase
MRVSYSYALRDQNRLAYEADEAFARRFAPPLSGEVAAYLEGQAIAIDEHHGIFADLWEQCGRNTRARARIQLAPANLHWCSDEALGALRDWSAKYQVGLHMHLVETAYQKEYARRRSGGTALQHLAELGLVGPRLTLGHGVWLTETDIDMAADAGVMICHNASSNLRLRSGVGPLNHWTARGVRVAIGLDEAGINDDRDMLQEMRLVLRLHRVPGMDDSVPTCPQVLRMATEDGAATTPYGGEIGTLEPGRAADLVLLSWRQIAQPYLDPLTSVVDAVVQRAKTSGVALVMVAGEVVLRDGRFTRIDREAALEELAASLRVGLTPEEERRRRLSREIFPVLKRFYDGWLDEDLRRPFYRPSSRV